MNNVTAGTRPNSSIVFVGNCQAAALAWGYNKYIAVDPADHAQSFDGRYLSESDRKTIAAASTIVVQVADLNTEDVELFDNAAGRVVRFPYVSGNFIWPFSTESHIFGQQMPLSEFGAFSDEMGGDKFLNNIVRERGEGDPQRAVEAYLGLDIISVGKVAQRFDLSQRMQKIRDDRSGIEIASYINSALSRERLFATRGHPFSGLFLHLAEQVFDQLGASSRAVNEMKFGLQPGPLEEECVPIHPQVIRYFGLAPIRTDGKFPLNMVIQSFEEYIVRYMIRDCDPNLMRGRRLAQSGQFPGAVEYLLLGLQRSPQSPQGWRLLSHTLHQLGRSEESLAAAENAVQTDPSDVQSLVHLTQLYLVLGHNDRAIGALGNLLLLYPNNLDGQRMSASVQTKPNR